MTLDLLKWFFLLGCYAICSGANVAYFAFSYRDLKKRIKRAEKENASDDESLQGKRAQAILGHLQNPNWTLASILLTNVVFGVLLSQLSDKLFVGILAVIAPVVGITIFGEFFAQATFLRYASLICSLFSPLIWILKVITAPISWPLAWLVDKIYGKEAIKRLEEHDLLIDLELEMTEFAGDGDTSAEVLDRRELQTLMNVAIADDELATTVGEKLETATILELPFVKDRPDWGDVSAFVKEVNGRSYHPWFVIAEAESKLPRFLLDADGLVRDYSLNGEKTNPNDHVYLAKIHFDEGTKIGDIMAEFKVVEEHPDDDVVDVDVAIIWNDTSKHIITGGDILGRILRGVARKDSWPVTRNRRISNTSKNAPGERAG